MNRFVSRCTRLNFFIDPYFKEIHISHFGQKSGTPKEIPGFRDSWWRKDKRMARGERCEKERDAAAAACAGSWFEVGGPQVARTDNTQRLPRTESLAASASVSAKIFSHFPPLPSRCYSPPSTVRFYLAGQFTQARYIHRIASDPTTYFPFSDHLLFYPFFPSPFPSLSLFLFFFFELGAFSDTSLLPFLPLRTVSSYLRLSFLSLFRQHILRAECTAKDAHSPRSSESRLESGEILIAPIGVRTYFPRRQRRVEAEGPRETRWEDRRSVARGTGRGTKGGSVGGGGEETKERNILLW